MSFEPTIGLEIHAQLATASKLFCSCPTTFACPPNANTCPVCMGLPGVLPVTNRQVVEFAIRLGLATHCSIRNVSQFARKNYFYPDLPKAYQISQYDRPICEHGWVDIEVEGKTKRVSITRIHIEEDAGKLVHEGEDPTASYVDLNRAGIPLLEIVSGPDMTTPEEAKAYMEKIHSLVTYLAVSHGDMEKGNLRADANVSIRPPGQKELGTRTETKNLNSFRFVRDAVTYEIERQADELREGRRIIQETRLWDAMTKTTFPMRSKEEAHDYRYFPDPDLPLVVADEAWVDRVRKEMPELPDEKKARYIAQFGLSAYDAGVLTQDRAVAEFYEAVLAAGADPKKAANRVTVDLAAKLNDTKHVMAEVKFTPAQLARLIALVDQGAISSKQSKEVFDAMYDSGEDPDLVVKSRGLSQMSNQAELEAIVAKIVADNPGQVEQFRAGKDKVFGFFVGQIMKATQGKANPALVNDLLKKKLG
ncbi:MAG: Asp-tRNA(Asn)/Glu-tRNA(Gln) amidotransferase subunit GatB [Deltaproteobacteria bacterium]|nr:Asp-tRNA(Asn)/Glu-tRNA(Gln) amidotransferase subunit GatB [Deltaproteobacteria bacterium]